jgi:hypothetical protein
VHGVSRIEGTVYKGRSGRGNSGTRLSTNRAQPVDQVKSRRAVKSVAGRYARARNVGIVGTPKDEATVE